MKLQEIPTRLGYSQQFIATQIEMSRQAFQKVLAGKRGKPNPTVEKLCAVMELNREEVFYQDAFSHWASEAHNYFNVAIEALECAARAGADREFCERLKSEIFKEGQKTLPENEA